MAETTGISWADHTMNFWIGCQAVSAACEHCYADTLVTNRMGRDFAERRRTVPDNWHKPFVWDRKAREADVRRLAGFIGTRSKGEQR
jgi:protein gp37